MQFVPDSLKELVKRQIHAPTSPQTSSYSARIQERDDNDLYTLGQLNSKINSERGRGWITRGRIRIGSDELKQLKAKYMAWPKWLSWLSIILYPSMSNSHKQGMWPASWISEDACHRKVPVWFPIGTYAWVLCLIPSQGHMGRAGGPLIDVSLPFSLPSPLPVS